MCCVVQATLDGAGLSRALVVQEQGLLLSVALNLHKNSELIQPTSSFTFSVFCKLSAFV